ncbi:Response regulator receiver domain-containing protein [Loktanella fryxellensis]|uniref:Response regulator receiver domain-containing protein n=1 Tax=Loktanella fryxellensis TaxID=245187 RepID=A0A1H8GZE5_9RHOB|nr:response regulator [Loktanella fryxellensis]SEN49084.1 Response regulator receiver domain-containing protein [Loktanella fryxellensis]
MARGRHVGVLMDPLPESLRERSINDGYGSMIVGYLFLSVAAGFVAGAAAFAMGASWWSILGVYTLVGVTGMFALSLLHLSWQRIARRAPLQAGAGALRRPPPVVRQADGTTRPVMTVMAVDDERFILDLVRIVGADAGHLRIVTATSGAAALRILSDPSRTIDYFLLDVSMPDMDGIALCRAIRQIPSCRDVPIVMLTARRDMQHISAAFQAGASDYATKPFDVDDLRQRLQMAYDVFRTGVDLQAAQAQGAAVAQDYRSGHVPALIDRLSLSHYIMRLAPEDMADVRVFAIRIDGIATLQARHAPTRIAALLEDIAGAVSRNLATLSPSGRTVMAYTGDSDLIVVTDAPVGSGRIEGIADAVRFAAPMDPSGDAIGLRVFIGSAVALRGERSERARMAIARAITLVDAAALQNDENTTTHLPRVSGT